MNTTLTKKDMIAINDSSVESVSRLFKKTYKSITKMPSFNDDTIIHDLHHEYNVIFLETLRKLDNLQNKLKQEHLKTVKSQKEKS